MLERYNPVLRIVCLALVGLILYQASRLAFKRDAVAVSRIESPLVQISPKSQTNSVIAQTNAPVTSTTTNARPPRPGSTSASAKPKVPPDIQALLDKIKQSQLFGPEIKPPPMALLGIAGKDVFLRSPNGQTGVIREGEELGGAKLIRIGTNRVLVEHEGQQKELTIFEGFGSETLVEKKDKP